MNAVVDEVIVIAERSREGVFVNHIVLCAMVDTMFRAFRETWQLQLLTGRMRTSRDPVA
jgi:hypothetical protein